MKTRLVERGEDTLVEESEPWNLRYLPVFMRFLWILFAFSFVGFAIFEPSVEALWSSAVASFMFFILDRLFRQR